LRATRPGIDYAPDTDRAGTALHPGDKVSFKTYPRGTSRGVVVICKRALAEHKGKWIPALCIRSEGGRDYALVSKGVRRLKRQ
jgi:hypothetical protein